MLVVAAMHALTEFDRPPHSKIASLYQDDWKMFTTEARAAHER
jgi:hypothetical protein